MTELFIDDNVGQVYLGIDPGASGGMAVVDGAGRLMQFAAMCGDTDRDTWEWIESCLATRAVMEQNTGYVGGVGNPGSAMFQFGRSHGLVEMALIATGIPYERVTPGVWQKALGIPGRKRTEAKGAWKNRLKAHAQQLFPDAKVTLATADALLIAVYCQRKHTGTLARI